MTDEDKKALAGLTRIAKQIEQVVSESPDLSDAGKKELLQIAESIRQDVILLRAISIEVNKVLNEETPVQ